MQPSELLEAAAEYINDHGWCQKSVQMADGRVCLIGALESAATTEEWCESVWEKDVYRDALNYLDTKCLGMKSIRWVQEFIAPGVGVVGFNDTVGRTKEEVIDLLTEGAKHFRDQGQ